LAEAEKDDSDISEYIPLKRCIAKVFSGERQMPYFNLDIEVTKTLGDHPNLVKYIGTK